MIYTEYTGTPSNTQHCCHYSKLTLSRMSCLCFYVESLCQVSSTVASWGTVTTPRLCSAWKYKKLYYVHMFLHKCI